MNGNHVRGTKPMPMVSAPGVDLVEKKKNEKKKESTSETKIPEDMQKKLQSSEMKKPDLENVTEEVIFPGDKRRENEFEDGWNEWRAVSDGEEKEESDSDTVLVVGLVGREVTVNNVTEGSTDKGTPYLKATGWFLEAKLENQDLVWQVDPGSCQTMVPWQVYDMLPERRRPELIPLSENFIQAGGIPLKNMGRGLVWMKIGGIKVRHWVVFSEVEYPLLGLDF